ncbi:polysaccharide pyruvyl transferase family protein [Marinobacter sp.]|uniref:polysaccharide pyruvyl transferase family protein n=1 Tax=Marinobacter sp. TaxID=50741 RepID=UPI003A9058D5
MKIAIMTQPLGRNYGGIMQAWALQQVLEAAGHAPVTIDRRHDRKGRIYNLVRMSKRAVKKAVGRWSVPLNFERYMPEILFNTRNFIEKNIVLSEPLFSTADLRCHFSREQYDAVIVGSDQTWRPKYSPNIYNFFLDFLSDSNIKRLAYAASFGVDDWEFSPTQTERCMALVKKFDVIGVRELAGVELCEQHLGVCASHVLDPTLLLDKENYQRMLIGKQVLESKGVYTYILDQLSWKSQVVDHVSELLCLPVYRNQANSSMAQLKSSNISDYVMPSVKGWVKGFLEADFVVTDSFHGMVFSIIFNKPFVALVNSGRGASRFYSLANQLGLSGRLVTCFSKEEIQAVVDVPIDYKAVNNNLDLARKQSERFLYESLSEG